MPDENEQNLEFQRFELWTGIWDKVQEFYRYYQHRWGFYHKDNDQRVRARLMADDTETSFTITTKDGKRVVKLHADEGVSFLESGKMGWEMTVMGLAWYDDAGIKRLQLDKDGLELINATGTPAARYLATATELYNANARRIFLDGATGVIVGAGGTFTYTLDPAALSANAAFKATEFCTNQENATIDALRTDPPEDAG